MAARLGWVGALLAIATIAHAEPKPKPVDIKPIRDELVVLQDPDGGTYVAQPKSGGSVWYGAAGSKNLYEQLRSGWFADTSTGKWDMSVFAPRVPDHQPGSISRRADGTYARWCGGDRTTVLTEVTGDKAKAILDKSTFLTTALVRQPHLLARDDTGTYYYVDVIRKIYGGKGYRVFIGKKGAMKQRPLTDIATDSAGDVFATKTGDLRIVRDEAKQAITWVKGRKRTSLSSLDVASSSVLIYKDLGIYTFLGSICESL